MASAHAAMLVSMETKYALQLCEGSLATPIRRRFFSGCSGLGWSSIVLASEAGDLRAIAEGPVYEFCIICTLVLLGSREAPGPLRLTVVRHGRALIEGLALVGEGEETGCLRCAIRVTGTVLVSTTARAPSLFASALRWHTELRFLAVVAAL